MPINLNACNGIANSVALYLQNYDKSLQKSICHFEGTSLQQRCYFSRTTGFFLELPCVEQSFYLKTVKIIDDIFVYIFTH